MTPTANFGFRKPEIEGDLDDWGQMLNDNWDQIDSVLQSGNGVSANRLGGLPASSYPRLTGGSQANFSTMPQVLNRPIISMSSNSDGTSLRYENGIQMNFQRRTGQVLVTQALQFNETQPVAFKEPPIVFYNVSGDWSEHYGNFRIDVPSATSYSVQMRFLNESDSPPNTTFTWLIQSISVGLWR